VVFRNKKFVKGRWAKLTFCGFKNEKWLGGIENSTKWLLEIKNLSRGGGQNRLSVVSEMKNGWEGLKIRLSGFQK